MTRMTSDLDNLTQLLQEGLVQLFVQGLTMVFVSKLISRWHTSTTESM